MQCKHQKENKEQCNSQALTDDQFCFWHSEKITNEAKKEARQNGGRANKLLVYEQLPPIPVNRPGDVVYLLEEVINKVREGKMDIKVANCLGFLSSHLLKAYEQTALKSKLETIEEIISNKKLT
jgi:hypothetical protein